MAAMGGFSAISFIFKGIHLQKNNFMKYTHLIAALCFLLSPQLIHAQENYTPDRPGIGNGSAVTEKGVFGLETGVLVTTSEFVNQFDIGQMLLRLGVFDGFEVRALLNSYTTQSFDRTNVERKGFNDIGLAAKYNFFTSDEGNTSVSALGKISFPVGSEAFTNNEIIPSLFVLADQSITEFVGVSSNLGYTPSVGDEEDNWLFTLTPSFTVPSQQNVGIYAGYAGIYSSGTNQQYIEGGVTLTVNDGAQIDINSGYELESETFFIGVGFAQGFK
jgi:hypothetical protein